jgi:ribosomal protein S18 acetylase RimI-like enzyme
MQYQARRAGYAVQYPDAESSIVMFEGQPAGHTLVARSGEGLRIVDIVVAPQFRGRGLGTAVLKSFLASGLPVRLQVARHNPAVRLYERLSFKVVASDDVNLEMEGRL